jgi:hypothetical protein
MIAANAAIVCQSQNVCQTAFAAAGGSSGSGSATSPLTAGQVGNQTLSCNTQSRVYAAQEMSCAVIVRSSLYLLFPLTNPNTYRTQHCNRSFPSRPASTFCAL